MAESADRHEDESKNSELRRSEALFRAVFRTAPMGMLLLDPGGRILNANTMSERLLGYPRLELTTRPLTSLLYPDDVAAFKRLNESLLAGKEEGRRGELRFVRKNKQIMVAAVTIALLGDAAEQPREQIVMIEDITDRRRLEDALRRNETLFRGAVESLLDAFAILSPIRDDQGRVVDFRIEYANYAALEISHQTREGSIGKVLGEVVAGIRETGLLQHYLEVAETGNPLRLDAFPYIDPALPEGTIVWIDVRAARVGNNIAVAWRDVSGRVRAQEEIRKGRELLYAFIDNTPAFIYVKDRDGKFTLVNQTLADAVGMPREALIGKTSYDLVTKREIADEHAASERQVLETGEKIRVEDHLEFEGEVHTFLTLKFPLRDPDGTIKAVGGVSTDITELKKTEDALRRERERIAALESVSAVGIAAQDLDEALEVLPELIADALNAYSCTIFLLDDETNDLVARAAHNIHGPCGFRFRPGEDFPGRIVETGRVIHVRDVSGDPAIKAPQVKHNGVKSLLGVPLVVRGTTIGAVYVDTLDVRDFDTDEIWLFEALASRVASIVDNARLMETITRNFQLLQRALVPPALPEIIGCKLAMAYIPAEKGAGIGGDFYDVFCTEAGKVAVIIGDVVGKGIPSASLAATTRNTVRAFAYETSCPAEALTHANAVISAEQGDAFLFVTVFVAIFDRDHRRVAYASAGHPPAAIWRKATGAVEFLLYGNPPVSIVRNYEFKASETVINPGDKIVFYTDGLDEARRNGELFGQSGIERVLHAVGDQSPSQIASAFVAAAHDWTRDRLADDLAMVVFECTS